MYGAMAKDNWLLRGLWKLRRVILMQGVYALIARWRVSECGARLTVDGLLETHFHQPRCNVHLGSDVFIGRRVAIGTGKQGVVVIGDDVSVNSGSFVIAEESVTIGRGTMIAENCVIRDFDHGIEGDSPTRLQSLKSAPIEIGEDVWLGSGVIVLKGVKIGRGAVVGAGAVVSMDVPARAVAVGVPARVIRSRDDMRAVKGDH